MTSPAPDQIWRYQSNYDDFRFKLIRLTNDLLWIIEIIDTIRGKWRACSNKDEPWINGGYFRNRKDDFWKREPSTFVTFEGYAPQPCRLQLIEEDL